MILEENTVIIKDIDSVFAQIYAPNNIFSSLYNHYSIYVKDYRFKIKNTNWDGKIHFIHRSSGKTYQGLIPDIISYLKKEKVTIDDRRKSVRRHKPTKDKYIEAYKHLDYKTYKPHKHQNRGAIKALANGMGILLHATGSGKTLTASIVINYLFQCQLSSNVLYIVPRNQLVDQTAEAMVDYGIDKAIIGKYYGGDEKDLNKQITIATWQSLSAALRVPKKYRIYDSSKGQSFFVSTPKQAIKKMRIKHAGLKKQVEKHMDRCETFVNKSMTLSRYDVTEHNKRKEKLLNYLFNLETLIVDECHGVDAKEIKNIVTKAVNTKYRYGFTGTLPDKDDDLAKYTTIKALLGQILDTQLEKDLIETNKLSPLEVRVVLMEYDNSEPGINDVNDYRGEKEFLMANVNRNKTIINISESHRQKDDNVLILVDEIEKHFNILQDLYLESIDDKDKIHFIHGGIKNSVREDIRNEVKETTGNIILATAGTTSVGIDIPSLNVIILGVSGKAKVRLLQSIGRGLRYVEDKLLHVYDISDLMKYGNRHLDERFKYYKQRDYPLTTITEPELKAFLANIH